MQILFLVFQVPLRLEVWDYTKKACTSTSIDLVLQLFKDFETPKNIKDAEVRVSKTVILTYK
ncbi:hypothetical protein ACX27_25160 [Nostoc piscinale CENA21]|uniref:Uncharacterized protein n=1 Tax=Nostoc piscinale CENA21 TaxID=224013 RepID=A0A0M4TXI6_9NOSO|nr:hypothetical protein ACX27_25160 [Nostoc piscinale CENA21]